MFCWKCGKEIESNEVFRTTECPSCYTPLHCCKGCRFYEPGRHFDCKETVDYPISDKEKENFCDYFSPIMEKSEDMEKAKKDRDAELSALDALFGGIVCL